MSLNPPYSEDDAFEAITSRQFAFYLRTVRTIRTIAKTHHEIKGGSLPYFAAQEQTFNSWLEGLPQDLQLTLPADGSPPSLPSHFIGNMHSHCQLGRIMLQRLIASKSSESASKQHMKSCHTSAKVLCRLQEAILAKYGLQGLLSMQRGINFTIYAVLTCVTSHLVRVSVSARTALAHSLQAAINSHDPELASEARDYFTRHMRILEKCINACPIQGMKAQISALCHTFFSADKDKPFQFKASVPSGTPSDSYRGHGSYRQPSSQSFPLVSRSSHSCVDKTRCLSANLKRKRTHLDVE